MTSCHPTILSVKAYSTFFLNQFGDFQEANIIVYQCLVGKLIYLGCGTRSDIVFVIGQRSCHNLDLQIGYLYIAKQVLHYFKSISNPDI